VAEIKNPSVFRLPGFRVDREIVTSGNRKSRNPELNQDRPSVETRGGDQESVAFRMSGLRGSRGQDAEHFGI
jgi:hypothetical protein